MSDYTPDGPSMADADVESLLAFIRDVRGFDFTGYKRSTLRRRLAKRMHDVGMDEVPTYRDRLETDPQEFDALFDTMLINVTSFFRDPACWEYLQSEIVPSIVDDADARHDDIRVWSAGCASGQETYSLAMAFAAALAEARSGSYSAEQMQAVPRNSASAISPRMGDGSWWAASCGTGLSSAVTISRVTPRFLAWI